MAHESLQHNLFQPFCVFVLVIKKPAITIPSVLHKMVNLMYLKKENKKIIQIIGAKSLLPAALALLLSQERNKTLKHGAPELQAGL